MGGNARRFIRLSVVGQDFVYPYFKSPEIAVERGLNPTLDLMRGK